MCNKPPLNPQHSKVIDNTLNCHPTSFPFQSVRLVLQDIWGTCTSIWARLHVEPFFLPHYSSLCYCLNLKKKKKHLLLPHPIVTGKVCHMGFLCNPWLWWTTSSSMASVPILFHYAPLAAAIVCCHYYSTLFFPTKETELNEMLHFQCEFLCFFLPAIGTQLSSLS